MPSKNKGSAAAGTFYVYQMPLRSLGFLTRYSILISAKGTEWRNALYFTGSIFKINPNKPQSYRGIRLKTQVKKGSLQGPVSKVQSTPEMLQSEKSISIY